MPTEDNHTRKIGLIGLGLVGAALMERLLEEGFTPIGCDIDPQRCRLAEQHGVTLAADPRRVAEQVPRVILSLPDSTVVEQVLTGPHGLLTAQPLPLYCLDTTTGDPETTERLARHADRHGLHLLDATLSGSSRQIRRKEAVFMVGGDANAFQTCRPLLKQLAAAVFYLGPPGSGARAKLAGNLILGLNRLVLAEGLVFAEQLGLDLPAFLEMLKHTPAYSAAMDSKGDKMIRADFTPDARLRQHHKDVTLILRYAQKNNLTLPLSRLHLDLLEKAIAAGDGDLDNSAVIRQLQPLPPHHGDA